MNTQIVTDNIKNVPCDALIIGAYQAKQGLHLPSQATIVDQVFNGLIHQSYQSGEFKGNIGEILTLHSMGHLTPNRVVVVGLGKYQQASTRTIQRASAIAARYLQRTGAHNIALAIEPGNNTISLSQCVQAETEGALYGLYTFRQYQQHENENSGVSQISIIASEKEKEQLQPAVNKAIILTEGINLTRTLVNEPPNVLTPSDLAHRAQEVAKETGLECEIFDRQKIQELGMGGLLAVSQGSTQPPYFIILHHRGASDSSKTMALVGKGITFDTGGISLKPTERMDEMKSDMAGAAAVIGAMQAIARLKPAINVTALIPTCENMPSGNSYHPGDVIRMFSGKTVEIINTDAEGRLILADALAYAVKEGFAPIIDLATLTGGILVALGAFNTGLFSNDQALVEEIRAAGQAVGEKFWQMPMDEEYGEMIRSDIADVKQTAGRYASSITAAKVLEHFVADTPWAHLDIAGTSYSDKKSYQEKGGTGVGVRTLVELVLRRAK